MTKNGMVMTPEPIVNMVLGKAGYNGDMVLVKKIMEPAFGDGNFLCEIVNRILKCCGIYGIQPDAVKNIIKKNVFGVEQDKELYQKAIDRLDGIMEQAGIHDMDWSSNLFCGNTLELFRDWEGQFDFVVGNPPYVKVRDMDENTRNLVKDLRFTGGSTDMYVAFMEMGLDMLNENGTLSMITPSSYLKNTSQQKLRDELAKNEMVRAVYDFKSDKVFDEGVYCCVSVLSAKEKKNPNIALKTPDGGVRMTVGKPMYPNTTLVSCGYKDGSVQYKNTVVVPRKKFSEVFLGKKWSVPEKDEAGVWEKMMKRDGKFTDIANIQNGVSTNAADIYTVKAYKDEELKEPYTEWKDGEKVFFQAKNGTVEKIESGILRRAVKASKYHGEAIHTYLIFPYTDDFQPITEDAFKGKYPECYSYMCKNKEKLAKRDMENNKEWYAFARSQGMKNSKQKKLVFRQTQKKDAKTFDVFLLDEDVLVFGGAYVTAGNGVDIMRVKEVMESEDFARYCTATGKSMANGYVSISTKQVKEYGYVAD